MAIDHDQKQASGGNPAAGNDAGSRDPDQQRRLMIARQRQVMKARAAADADRAEKVDNSEPVEDGPALEADASRKNGAVKKTSKETTTTGGSDVVTTEQSSTSSTDRNANKGGSSSKTTTVDGADGSTSRSSGYGWKNTATQQGGEAHVETSVEDEHGKQTDHVGVTGKRDANGVQAGTEVSRTNQVGNATTSNKVGVSATDHDGHLAGDANVAHSQGNGREETTVGASGHLGEDGPSGQISAGQQEKDGKGQETGSSKVAVGASKKGVSGSVETSDTTRDDEGNVHKEGSKLHGQVGKGGVVAGYDGTSTVTDKNGAATSSSKGAEIDTKAGTISGHLSETKTNARGEQTGSDSVGATVGKDQASVSASHSKGSTSVSVAGGFKVTADPAVFDEATQEWLVSWRMELQGSASAKQGSKNGVSGGASAFTEREGVEVFDTKEAAEAFSKSAATELMGGAGQVPQDAEGVLEGMKVGEQRGTASGVDVSENATAQLDVVKLGAGAEEGMHHGLSLKRISKTEVEVTVDKTEFVKGAISGGAAGISVGKRAEKSKGSSIRVRFDLSTEEGKQAFDAYQENRRLLPGAVVVAEDVSEEEGTGTDVSAAGQQVSMSSTTSEHHGKDEKGKYDDYKGKQSFQGKINVPGVINYRANESNQIHERDQGGEQSYEATTSIDDSGGKASAEALGEATGGDSENPDAKSSGHWTVTSHFTADDIKEIAEKAQRGALVGGEQHLGGDLAELQKTLAAAGNDTQKQMKAISKYVADCGPEALADLRENVSRFQPDQYGKKQDQEFDLKLDGDRNFTGPAFWHDLDARIAGYQASLKQGDAASVLNGIDADRTELKRREGEISKLDQYTDLPEQLRQAQITRTQNHLSLLETIRSTAVASLQSKPEAAQKTEGPNARVQSAMESLAEGKADCARTFDKARTIRWYLRGAHASPDGFSSVASARDWIHKNGDSHDHKVWPLAEEHFAGAMQHKVLAETYEGGMEALQREFLTAPNEAAAGSYAAAIEKAATQYSSASDGFASAHGIYANLLDRHPDWRHNLMVSYDEGTIAPPGAGLDE